MRALLGGVLLGTLSACAATPGRSEPHPTRAGHAAAASLRAVPARPAACAAVPAGEALQPRIARAAAGATLCLEPGEHLGPVAITTPLTLWGPPTAVVRSQGTGTLIHVTAPGTRLLGFGMRMQGGLQDRESAALRVTADDVLIEGVELLDVAFGVHVEGARRLRMRGNRIVGAESALTGLRGDALRLWETRDSVIAHNEITGARDIVVWYSPHNTLRENRITHGRYGVHFMYSADNEVEDNHIESCVVGIFVMYSRGIVLARNHLVDASGAAGMGVGLKESGNITLRDNLFVRNTIGLYLDTSPLYLGDRNLFERNRLLFSGKAVVFHGRATANEFRNNELHANQTQVDVEGGGNALESVWTGNAFDDYVGYDLDQDGIGDVPYTLRSLAGELTARYPEARYFHGSPALQIIEAVAQMVPIVTPRTLVIDRRPRFAMPGETAGTARGTTEGS